MKNTQPIILIAVAVASMTIGFVGGFFLGVASTNAGRQFLEELVEEEQQADVTQAQSLVRARFELRYPSNWQIDANDEDYDPDQMFSIDSPGATYVLFIMGNLETDPEENLQEQIESYSKLMGTPTINRFDSYGKYQGKGATVSGKILGARITVKAFSCFEEGMTAIIVQQYPDEDLNQVEEGLSLIEKSFTIRPQNQQNATSKPAEGDVQ